MQLLIIHICWLLFHLIKIISAWFALSVTGKAKQLEDKMVQKLQEDVDMREEDE